MHFHCVRHVLRCRGHRGRRRGISVGKYHQLSGLVLPVTLDWTRQMLELLPRSIGWDGSVTSSWTHWPSSCQSDVQHHQRRHWSTTLYCSRRVFRGIVIWFCQPQLLSNATSGYGFHATASRLSQPVPYRVYIIMCPDFREDLMAGPERGRLRTDCGNLTCSKSDTSRTRGPLAVWRGMVACSPVR